MTTDVLKPCPFCGGKAEVNHMAVWFGEPGEADPNMALVTCKDLSCVRQSGYQSTGKAITDWNRRAKLAEANNSTPRDETSV